MAIRLAARIEKLSKTIEANNSEIIEAIDEFLSQKKKAMRSASDELKQRLSTMDTNLVSIRKDLSEEKEYLMLSKENLKKKLLAHESAVDVKLRKLLADGDELMDSCSKLVSPQPKRSSGWRYERTHHRRIN